MSASRAVLRAELLDVLRDPLAVAQRAIPLAVFLIGVGIAVATAISGDVGDERRRVVGVDDAVLDDAVLVDAMAEEDLDVVLAPDAERFVADGTLDAAVDSGPDGYVVLDRDDEDDPPRMGVAARRVLLALAAVDEEANPVPTQIPRVETEVEPTVTRLRDAASIGAASLLLGLLGTVVGSVAARFRDDHRSGVLASQLGLPIGRRRLLLVKVGAESTLVAVAMSPFLFLAVALAAVLTWVDDGVLATVTYGAAALLLGVSTLASFGLAGLLLTARHPDRPVPAVATLIGFLIAGSLAVWSTYVDGKVTEFVSVVPVAGLWEVARRAAVGAGSPAMTLVAIATSAAAIAWLSRAAVRAIDRDAFGMRAR